MNRIIYLLPFMLVLCFYSCNKPEDAPDVFDETCDNQTFNGLNFTIDGDASSLMEPGGEIYNNYLACVQNCSETDPDNNDCIMNCLSSSGIMPSGGLFTVVMYITNITTQDITITLEPGTWFFPGSDDYQPMIIVVTVTITITAGETVIRPIPVFCLASDKSAPDESSDYLICNKASFDCLTEIVEILKTKDFAQISIDQTYQIQSIIWDCSEGNPVDYDYLNALPSL